MGLDEGFGEGPSLDKTLRSARGDGKEKAQGDQRKIIPSAQDDTLARLQRK